MHSSFKKYGHFRGLVESKGSILEPELLGPNFPFVYVRDRFLTQIFLTLKFFNTFLTQNCVKKY